MEIYTVAIVIALTLLVGLFIARPLLAHGGRSRGGRLPLDEMILVQRDLLEDERQHILDTLRELENGREKEQNAAAYETRRSSLMRQGAEVLRRLDQLEKSPQQAIDEVEVRVALRRRVRFATQPAGFCPICGAVRQAGDSFCARCGAKL